MLRQQQKTTVYASQQSINRTSPSTSKTTNVT